MFTMYARKLVLLLLIINAGCASNQQFNTKKVTFAHSINFGGGLDLDWFISPIYNKKGDSLVIPKNEKDYSEFLRVLVDKRAVDRFIFFLNKKNINIEKVINQGTCESIGDLFQEFHDELWNLGDRNTGYFLYVADWISENWFLEPDFLDYQSRVSCENSPGDLRVFYYSIMEFSLINN